MLDQYIGAAIENLAFRMNGEMITRLDGDAAHGGRQQVLGHGRDGHRGLSGAVARFRAAGKRSSLVFPFRRRAMTVTRGMLDEPARGVGVLAGLGLAGSLPFTCQPRAQQGERASTG